MHSARIHPRKASACMRSQCVPVPCRCTACQTVVLECHAFTPPNTVLMFCHCPIPEVSESSKLCKKEESCPLRTMRHACLVRRQPVPFGLLRGGCIPWLPLCVHAHAYESHAWSKCVLAKEQVFCKNYRVPRLVVVIVISHKALRRPHNLRLNSYARALLRIQAVTLRNNQPTYPAGTATRLWAYTHTSIYLFLPLLAAPESVPLLCTAVGRSFFDTLPGLPESRPPSACTCGTYLSSGLYQG